jgi:hypothetical protein
MSVVYSVKPYDLFLALCCLSLRNVNINSYTPASTTVAIIRSNVTYRNSLYQRYPVANYRVYIGSHIDWEWLNVIIHISMLFIVKTRVQVISRPCTWLFENVAPLSWLWLCHIWETGEDRQELWIQKVLWSWITCHQLLKPTVEGAVSTRLFCKVEIQYNLQVICYLLQSSSMHQCKVIPCEVWHYVVIPAITGPLEMADFRE